MKEMLDRASAFTVYQTLSTSYDKEAERKRRDAALTQPKETPETTGDANTENDTEPAVTDEGARAALKEKESTAPASVKDEKERVDPRSQFKALVNDVQVFSAFAHFDQNLCGYLLERDAEDVIHSIGLDLSRGDVQRLLKNVLTRERLNYRNLTDKWVDKEGQVKYASERMPNAPTASDLANGKRFVH